MNTQSHSILTFFIIRKYLELTHKEYKSINPILFTGALMPDLPLFMFFVFYSLISPTSQQVIWRELYFHPSWQIVFDLFHSLPLWGILFLLSFFAKRYQASIFCMAALLASAQDLLVHYEDAHAHFFPFSDYRFASPVSYWNPEHYGRQFAVIEILMVVVAGIWTFKRLESKWGKIVLIFAIAALITSSSMWSFIFSYL
jgi:hypothetical protein